MNKEYPNYISPKRRPVATPEKIVIDGKAQFGTFDEPFETLNLLDCRKPCGALYPKCLNRKRLTEWEAFEINMDELSLVSAIYNTGSLGFSIMVIYDKAAHKIYSWKNFVSAKAAHVAPQLVNGVSELKTKKSDYKIINDLKNGKARAVGYSENKKYGKFEIDMSVERVSPISNVCIPFGKNKPLYSEKDFFKAVGYITINGKKYESNGNTVSIIDDHKGYYPFIAHYDWLTAMGKLNIGGTEKYFAFNLPQSTFQHPAFKHATIGLSICAYSFISGKRLIFEGRKSINSPRWLYINKSTSQRSISKALSKPSRLISAPPNSM